MDDDRRQFLIGLGSALATGMGFYAGYRYALDRGRDGPQPDARAPAATPPGAARSAPRPRLELAQIQAELGRSLAPDSAEAALAFDRRAPFAEVRQALHAQGPSSVELLVEVHSHHRAPHLAGLPILLDVGPEPGMLAQDAEARAALAANEAMPLPWTYTGIRVGPKAIRVDHGGKVETLEVPAIASESEGWAAPMWVLAQRAGVSRLHGRRPWIFVDDATPWALVIRVIEACAPPPCQPHNDTRDRCTWRWASLFVGPPST